MKNYKISIIIPVYNTEKYIKECIESIIKQTYKNIEIIIVNDGSKDNSLSICNEYALKDKRIKVINQKNKGQSSARNKGIKNSNGDYILFVDSDDWIEENMLEILIKKANTDLSDIVICSHKIINENSVTNIVLEKKHSFEEYLFESTTMGYSMCKMIKKSCINRYFREDIFFMEDMIFWMDNKQNINKVSYIPNCLYNYRMTNTSVLHSKKYNKRMYSLLESAKILVSLVPEKYKNIYRKIYLDSFFKYRKHLSYSDYIDYKEYFKMIIQNKNEKKLYKLKSLIKKVIICIKQIEKKNFI